MRRILNKLSHRNVLGLALYTFGGVLLGLAWRDYYPFWLGLTGQAFFFAGLATCRSMLASLVGACSTGLIATVVSCGQWLPETIEYLVNCGSATTFCLASVVSCVQSMPYLLTAIIWQSIKDLKSAWFYLPSVWCVGDFFLPELYPIQLGHLLSEATPINQIAEFGGVYLLTIIAAHIAVFPAVFICDKPHEPTQSSTEHRLMIPRVSFSAATFLITVSISVLAAMLWGNQQFELHKRKWDRRKLESTRLKLMIVQAETEFEFSNRRMIKASRAAGNKPDLIVWPESALGNYDRELKSFSDERTLQLSSFGEGARFRPFPNPTAPLLAGANTYENLSPRNDGSTNYVSALLIDKAECLVGRHDKIKLMPYGEYIPGERFIPHLRTWFGGPRIISRGITAEPIGTIENWNVGAILCCEDMYPELCRTLAAQGCDILISIGNEMAFQSEIPLRQHFRISRLRSIENRKPFVRCMNRGVSAVIMPNGTVAHELPVLAEGAILLDVPKTGSSMTTFTRFGSAPSLLVSFSICAIACFAKFRKHRP